MNTNSDLNKILIDAIEEKQLRQTIKRLEQDSESLPEEVRNRLNAIQLAISKLDSDVENEITRVSQFFKDHNISVASVTRSYPGTVTHGIDLVIVDRSEASKAAELLERIGYESALREKPQLWNHFVRFHKATTFWPTAKNQFRIRLHWQPHYQLAGRVGGLFRPAVADLESVSLPDKLWPVYCLVRLFRRCFAKQRPAKKDLGPFLGTPTKLIEPLLEFSGLQSGQQLVDLGCGDGRVLIAAAEKFSSHAIGYETDARLLSDAKEKASLSGFDQRIEILDTDARDADVSQADVVFIFLPINAIASLLPSLMERMKPGAVLIAHEQQKLDVKTKPIEKLPIIHASGVTVAHKWRVEAP